MQQEVGFSNKISHFCNNVTNFFSRTQPIENQNPLPIMQLESTKDLKENKFEVLIENPAYKALHCANIFPSQEQKDLVHRMAEVADLMYDMGRLEEVQKLFPGELKKLPTPQELGLNLPAGLFTQAFIHENEILFAIRGTNLGHEISTSIANVVADAGIGRHKDNSALISSVNATNDRITSLYGERINKNLIESFAKLVESRVLGSNDNDRALEMLKRFGGGLASGGKTGAKVGAIVGGLIGGLGLALSLANPLTAVVFGGLVVAIGTGAGGIVEAGVETAKCATVMDGNPTLESYIKTSHDYMMALKKGGYINEKEHSITVIGHSLGGYLTEIIGRLHGDDFYSFNGPGVVEGEMLKIIANLGLDQEFQEDVTPHCYSMDLDFIGNLCKGKGLQTLHIPIEFDEMLGSIPSCTYDNLLAHHSIKLMKNVIANASVSSIPRSLSPNNVEIVVPKVEKALSIV